MVKISHFLGKAFLFKYACKNDMYNYAYFKRVKGECVLTNIILGPNRIPTQYNLG